MAPAYSTARSFGRRYAQALGGSDRATARAALQAGVGRIPAEAAQVRKPGSGNNQRDPRLARIEAVLFLAQEPLGSRKISQFASLADATEARTLIRRLNGIYDSCGSAFRVEEVAGGYQLMTRQKFAGWLRRLTKSPMQARLSGPALETLAVVAYRQPILRAAIESIRGVQCGEMLRQLMDRDFVRITGRSTELGRPFLYGTTRRFLQAFGLRHLDELPRAEYLRGGATASATSTTATSGAEPSVGSSQEHRQIVLKDSTEEPDVSTVAEHPLAAIDLELEDRRFPIASEALAAADEDDDIEDEEDDDEEDDDEEEEDFEDDDWEEVDDEEEDDELEDDEDDDWDDDEDEDWDDDEEEDDDWDDDEEEDEEEEEK